MLFRKAFELMKQGKKLKLPSWAGYWYWSKDKQTIIIHTKDGVDMRMTQARMEAFVPGGDAVLADVYRRVRGTRSWHPVVKELKKLLDEIGEKRYED